QHRSDMKQISYAIAGNAEFFITEDAQLLSNFSEIVHSEFGLKIVRPDDLIISLDELINSAKYQQNRLAGSTMRISRVTAGQSDLLAQTFQAQSVEKKSQFAFALRQFLSEPHKYETHVITSPNNEPLAMLIYTWPTPTTLEIPIIRVVERTGLFALASHLIFWAVNVAVKNRGVVVATEKYLSEEVLQGLQENSFSAQDDKWVKVNIPGILNLATVEQELASLSSRLPQFNQTYAELLNRLAQAQRETSLLDMVEVERALWPVKLSQAKIPSYLMPIRADWASDLFDPELGRQKLWGADPNLIFKMDNVYYRAARPKLPQAPSRILWYVSRGQGKQRYHGDMSIRACSYVDEVMIGTPKELFKKFHKLGVYNWQDVYSTAKENVDQEILAFRFSHTELLDCPIPLETLKETLGWRGAPQGPVRLDVEHFEKLYRIGFKETGNHAK
ncbi:MAG TPA: hypothetical protein P5526_27205, partial [Anaerolineae bacterium]|nr:hypothetical protein [Anaerolineae bacterium]